MSSSIQGQQSVFLSSHHDLYLTTTRNGGLFANANINTRSTQFKIIHSDDVNSTQPIHFSSEISLISNDGRYVVAEWDGNAHANRDAMGPWERWVIQNPNDINDTGIVSPKNTIALFSDYHQLYLVAELNGSVNANRSQIGTWETWTIDGLPDDDVEDSNWKPQNTIPGNVPGASAWNNYGKLINQLAQDNAIETAVVLAIVATESGASGFRDGRLIIRFENHIFRKNMQSIHQLQKYNNNFRIVNSNHQYFLHGEWQSTHTGNQNSEWEAFQLAQSLHNEFATQSISMGAPQIMGFNHSAIGFTSAVEMLEAFSTSETQHYTGLFQFLKHRNLITSIQQKQFATVAKRYNGAEEPWSTRMQSAYQQIKPKLNAIGVA